MNLSGDLWEERGHIWFLPNLIGTNTGSSYRIPDSKVTLQNRETNMYWTYCVQNSASSGCSILFKFLNNPEGVTIIITVLMARTLELWTGSSQSSPVCKLSSVGKNPDLSDFMLHDYLPKTAALAPAKNYVFLLKSSNSQLNGKLSSYFSTRLHNAIYTKLHSAAFLFFKPLFRRNILIHILKYSF